MSRGPFNKFLSALGVWTDVSPDNPLPTANYIGGSIASSTNPYSVNVAQVGGVAVDPNAVAIVSGLGYSSAVDLTRTNDTNGYTAGDVIGAATGSTAALTFAGIGPTAGGSVIVTTVRFTVDISSVVSGMTSFRLRIYSATPPSAYGDNAVWDLPAGDRTVNRGYIDLGTPLDVGSTLEVETTNINKHVFVPAGGSLYAYLVTNGTWTPAASTVFRIVFNAIGV